MSLVWLNLKVQMQGERISVAAFSNKEIQSALEGTEVCSHPEEERFGHVIHRQTNSVVYGEWKEKSRH